MPVQRRFAVLVGPFVTLLLAACQSNVASVDIGAEERTRRQRSLDFAAAEASNDADSALTFLWEDATLQPPSAPQIQGHDAIRALYKTCS